MEHEPPVRKIQRIKECIEEINKFEPILDAHEQRFKLFMESGQIHYLDEKKTIALVTCAHLTLITDDLAATRQQLLDSNKKFNLELQDTTKQLREIQIQKEKIQNLQFNLKNEHKLVNQLKKELDQYKKKLQSNQQQQKNYLQNINIIKIDDMFHKHNEINTRDTAVQTQYWIPKIQIRQEIKQENIIKVDQKGELEARLQQIASIFQKELAGVREAMQRKIYQIQNLNISIQQWVAKNRILQQQNINLKSNISKLNIQEQRTKHWKQQVQQHMKRLENIATTTLQSPTFPTSFFEQKPSSIFNHNLHSYKVQNELLRNQIEKFKSLLLVKQLQIQTLRNSMGKYIHPQIMQQQIQVSQKLRTSKSLEQQAQKLRHHLAFLDQQEVEPNEDEGVVKKITILSEKIKTIIEFLTSE